MPKEKKAKKPVAEGSPGYYIYAYETFRTGNGQAKIVDVICGKPVMRDMSGPEEYENVTARYKITRRPTEDAEVAIVKLKPQGGGLEGRLDVECTPEIAKLFDEELPRGVAKHKRYGDEFQEDWEPAMRRAGLNAEERQILHGLHVIHPKFRPDLRARTLAQMNPIDPPFVTTDIGEYLKSLDFPTR